MKLQRFFKTPKGLVIIVMAILTVVASIGTGVRVVAPVLLAAVIPAMLIDTVILRVKKHRWAFPDGALLTGLFVGLILSPHQRWQFAAATAAVAIVSKYIFRIRTANVFNPAAVALVATFYIFNTGQSWWGALPEISPIALVLLFGTGIFVTQRVNKIPVVLTFLGVFYLLVTTMAYVSDPAKVAELYRAPDVNAALFFAFFMVTDPPTSPPKHHDQIVYGIITAVASFAVYEIIHAAYFLLAGLLVANVWEAVRRWRAHRAKMATMRFAK